MTSNLSNSLNKLKEVYSKKLNNEDVVYYKDIYENLSKENLPDLRMKVHKMSGTAGMYGFSELSTLAHEFELYLDSQIEKDLFPENEIKDKILGIINNIEQSK